MFTVKFLTAFFKILLFMWVCVSHTHRRLWEPEKDVGCLGAGVTGSYEKLTLGAGTSSGLL